MDQPSTRQEFVQQMAPLPETSQANVKDGLWFVFPIGDRTIRAWGGATGLERIYLDVHVVSEHRNLGRLSTHSFSDGGQEFEVVFRTHSYMKAHVECTLLRNKEPIKTISVRYVFQTSATKRPLLNVAAGAATGVAIGFMKWPFWLALIPLVGILVVQAKARSKLGSTFVFEEHSIPQADPGEG